MTNTYPLIHLNNQSYMVDKVFIYENKDWWIHPSTGSIGFAEEDLVEPYLKIVTSTDKSLNLPLLPPIEEDVEQLANKATVGANNLETARYYYAKGYKAASAKKWTDEDIRKALRRKDENWFDDSDDKIIQSLNPLPKFVEVEMEYTIGGLKLTHGNSHITPDLTLKVDENNFVKVIRYIYEK